MPSSPPPPPKKRARHRPFGTITRVKVRGAYAPGFYIRYRTIDADGRTRVVQKKAGDTLAEAKTALHKIAVKQVEESSMRRTGRVRDITIANFASLEYLPVLEARATPSHLSHVISRIDAASRYFGDRPMRTITRDDIEDFFAAYMRGAVPPRQEVNKDGTPRKRRQPKSTNSQHHLRSCLQPMWKEAVTRRASQINPFQGLHLKRLQEHAVPYVNQEQLRKLIAACPPSIKPFVTLLAESGLRSGEAAALRWSSVVFEGTALEVVKSKSGKVRHIPLTTAAQEVFKTLRVARGAIPLDGDPLVFEALPGPNARLRIFKAAARRVGLPQTLRLHDLRHTFASHLAQAGIPLATIAELCGHGSLQMVQRYAKHVPNSAGRQAIDRLTTFRALPGPRVPDPAPQREAANSSGA